MDESVAIHLALTKLREKNWVMNVKQQYPYNDDTRYALYGFMCTLKRVNVIDSIYDVYIPIVDKHFWSWEI
jgi:hypothetical protein